MMENNELRIVSFRITGKNPVVKLSKTQKIVCRIFNIIPETRYWYHLSLNVTQSQRIRIGDSLLMIDGSTWRVIRIGVDIIITNENPLLGFRLRTDDPVVILANYWYPDTGEPTTMG